MKSCLALLTSTKSWQRPAAGSCSIPGQKKESGSSHGLITGLLMGENCLEFCTMLQVSPQQGLPVWRLEELRSSRFEAGQDGCCTGIFWSPNVFLQLWNKLKFQSEKKVDFKMQLATALCVRETMFAIEQFKRKRKGFSKKCGSSAWNSQLPQP